MLRGNHSAKIDEKGRIKIPSSFRHYIDERYGAEFYVTSLYGDCARLYPMPEWINVEEKLKSHGTMDRAVRKFLDRTSYFGQTAEMDSQGRILIHQNLRQSAGLTGELAVLGYLQYIEVWSWDAFKARIDAQPFTEEDAAELARFQI